MGVFDIKIGKGKIYFDSIYGDVTDQQLYDRKDKNFNFDNVYKVTNYQNSWYFRFGWQKFINSQSIFLNVKWLQNKIPPSGKYHIDVVKLKLVQKGSIILCTIGDSQTWWNKAGELRKLINSEYKDIRFVGSRTDFNGYPHEGEGGNSSSQVLQRLQYIPKADYYTLLIGTNDWKKSLDSAKMNIINIADGLLEKYPESKVMYLTPLPTSNKVRDDFNTELKEQLISKFKSNRRILIVNIGEKMREDSDWLQKYFAGDGLHQNLIGVKFMAQIIANKI